MSDDNLKAYFMIMHTHLSMSCNNAMSLSLYHNHVMHHIHVKCEHAIRCSLAHVDNLPSQALGTFAASVNTCLMVLSFSLLLQSNMLSITSSIDKHNVHVMCYDKYDVQCICMETVGKPCIVCFKIATSISMIMRAECMNHDITLRH